MAAPRPGWVGLISLVALSALALLPALGQSGRLTYHEAFVAQGAREMLASGNWAFPTIGGVPWLEKPPMPWWLVSAVAWYQGGVTETVARFPSTLAATGIVLGVAVLATRHYGSSTGLLAGAIQATTVWTVVRGRLAEADVLLACLITWALIAFDRLLCQPTTHLAANRSGIDSSWRLWRWAFFVLLGTSALVKGIGFGAILILVVVASNLIWQKDLPSLRRLGIPAGWVLALVIALWWPLLMLAQHGYNALSLWTMHISNRVFVPPGAGAFAGESWPEYVFGLIGQGLPWAPLALVGAWRSLVRVCFSSQFLRSRVSAQVATRVVASDRLLCAWAFVPLGLLTLAPVRNAHYAISAQIPWSIWAALTLGRIRWCQGFWFRPDCISPIRLVRIGFGLLALVYGLGFWALGPWLDRRGPEWAFYETAGQEIPTGVPVTFIYDDWDRKPYESRFGLIPHDLAVRLFYLDRSACWHTEPGTLLVHSHLQDGTLPHFAPVVSNRCPAGTRNGLLAVIGRNRDLPILEQLGRVDVIAQGPTTRRDRSYVLFQVVPKNLAPLSVGRGQTEVRY
jgi:hypothetical protein